MTSDGAVTVTMSAADFGDAAFGDATPLTTIAVDAGRGVPAQRLARPQQQPAQQIATPAPAKPALDAETVRLLTELGARPGAIEADLIRAALTNGRDLITIVESIAGVVFRDQRKAGEGWRVLCPALHEAQSKARFGAAA